MRVRPGESQVVTLEFDPSAEPDFVGGLSIDVTGYTGAAVAFATQAILECRALRSQDTAELAPLPDGKAPP
jgi:hypothetical protein